jgi:hypothetical protein
MADPVIQGITRPPLLLVGEKISPHVLGKKRIRRGKGGYQEKPAINNLKTKTESH